MVGEIPKGEGVGKRIPGGIWGLITGKLLVGKGDPPGGPPPGGIIGALTN